MWLREEDKRVGLFHRRLEILCKRGLFGNGDLFTRRVDDLITKRAAKWLKSTLFGHVDRRKYWPGWGQK